MDTNKFPGFIGRFMTDFTLVGGALIKLSVFLLPCLFFLLLMRMPLAESVNAQDKEEEKKTVNPHNFTVRQYCPYCHTAELPKLSFDPVTTCTKCHMGNIDNHPVTQHPIGKEPRINIPANFPLTKDGKIVCSTCHDPHNRRGLPKMLRVEYDKLCASCHVGY